MNLKKPKAIKPRISRRLDLLGKKFVSPLSLATVESCGCSINTTLHAIGRLIVVVLNLSGLGLRHVSIIC